MKRLARLLIRLYPSAWRARYGEEFGALIEDTSPRWSTTFDLLKGAISMQLRVRNFPRLALLLSTAGLLIGLGLSFVVTPRFVSTATLVLYSDSANEHVMTRLMNIQSDVLSRTSLSFIMQDPRLDLYPTEREHAPLDDVIETMRHNIHVETAGAAPNYHPFTIQFVYRDRSKAQQTVMALSTQFQDRNQLLRHRAQIPIETEPEANKRIQQLEVRVALLERRLGVGSDVEAASDRAVRPGGILLEVLDPPSLPVAPAWPNQSVFAASGFATGFALALIFWILRRLAPPVLRVESTQQ